MKKHRTNIKRISYCVSSLLIFILNSCGPFIPSTLPGGVTGTASSQPVEQLTIPALPAVYQSQFLNPLDVPHTYMQDNCLHLRNKWKPTSAAPGTVVMIIMFKEISNPNRFHKLMTELHAQNFEAITTKQFLFFMERNIRIPFRSVLLIQDGNFESKNFDENFRPYWDSLGWPVVNGWVGHFDVPRSMLKQNVELEKEGWVDHQSLGVTTDTVLSDDTSKTVITRELGDSLTEFADHYGKTPYAFIWPNGGFALRPVQAARQLGYQLGFTSNSRGPVMYNWVPLANVIDPERSQLIPEGQINDPLMTLPRYSADEALDAIDFVRVMGQEAAIYQKANKSLDLNYYNVVCKSTYGEIPIP
ncbi:MAG: hypothetical protein HZB50_11805 [Chloroflexi bacterium]|nr:hypothetical protein [Chloroflexota bacterium]